MKRLLHLCVSPNSHLPHLYISQKQISTFTGCSNELLVFIYIKEENSNRASMSSIPMSLGIFYLLLLLLLYGPRCQEQNQSVKILEQPTGCHDTALAGHCNVQERAGTLTRVMTQTAWKERVARLSQLRTLWSVGFPYLVRPGSRGYSQARPTSCSFLRRLPCLLEKGLFYNPVLKMAPGNPVAGELEGARVHEF